MSWGSVKAFAYGVVVELTWWATKPIWRLLDRGRR